MLFNNIPADRVALREGERRVTYGELAGLIAAGAGRLGGSTRAALVQDNGIDWAVWALAAARSGCVLVPIPPFFSSEQVAHTLTSAGCDTMINRDGVRPLPYAPVALPEGTAQVTFTSGTTGTPKGVCLSLEGMERVARSLVDVLGGTIAGGTHLCSLPLAVLLEHVAGVYTALEAGCTVDIPSLASFGLNYANLRTEAVRSGATSVILVPETLRILMQQVERDGPLPDLKFVAVGGSRVNPRLLERAWELGLPVHEGYGLSECASVVALNTPAAAKPNSVGRPLPHVRLAVEGGEIVVANPAFLGYVGEPHSGAFATGDLGGVDGDGFVRVDGRSKNVLITSYGRNISPEWVEAALLSHPMVAQVLVHGDGQPYLEALIVPAWQGADIGRAVASANATLPDYARVKDYRLVPPFTMANGMLTGTGRPRRQAILAAFLDTPTNNQGERA